MSVMTKGCLRGLLLASSVLAGSAAIAQTGSTVQLKSTVTGVTVSGEFLSFKNGEYRLNTSVGVMIVPATGTICTGAACVDAAPSYGVGKQVMLFSKDGSTNIKGTVDSVDGTKVSIRTKDFGVLTIDPAALDCAGPGCPEGSETTPIAVVQEVEEPAAPQYAPRIDPSLARASFAGSDTVGLGLLPYLLKDYADYIKAKPDMSVMSETETFVRYMGADGSEATSLYVNATGSGDAFDALEAREAEIGMTSRPIKDKEVARMEAAGAGSLRGTDTEAVIAVDSLAVITHPSNPVKELTMQQIGAMYLGTITNWSQVGGPDAPITVLSREDGSSTRGVFEKAVFSGDEPPLAERVTYPGGDNPEIAAEVRNNPYAIGYVGFSYSEGLNRISLTSSCGITSTARPFDVKTEEYPLGRRLYFYTREDNLPKDAQRFIEYVLSPEADDAIAQSSFVNFAVERQEQSPSRRANLFRDVNTQSEMNLAYQMQSDLRDWDRLSTTVRFQTASSTLGNKEINDLNRLIAYLDTQPAGTEVAIVGFADSIGAFDRNSALSKRRAASVANSIKRLGGSQVDHIKFVTKAYSELAPSVCNTDENGRAINRRVEIWVRN